MSTPQQPVGNDPQPSVQAPSGLPIPPNGGAEATAPQPPIMPTQGTAFPVGGYPFDATPAAPPRSTATTLVFPIVAIVAMILAVVVGFIGTLGVGIAVGSSNLDSATYESANRLVNIAGGVPLVTFIIVLVMAIITFIRKSPALGKATLITAGGLIILQTIFGVIPMFIAFSGS